MRMTPDLVSQRVSLIVSALFNQHVAEAKPAVAIERGLLYNTPPLFFRARQVSHIGVDDRQVVPCFEPFDATIHAGKVQLFPAI
jgi:hypothetical protein